MKLRFFLSMVMVVVMAGSVMAAPRQGMGRGSGGWGMGGAYQRMFNPATVETVNGTVDAIDKVIPMKGMSYGVHLLLTTDKGKIPVHLGPGWYVERLDADLKKGDTVEVKGSRVTIQGKPAIIAEEVKRGDDVLKLRDDNGNPAWAGWRRK